MHFWVSAARVGRPGIAPGHLSTSGFRWPRKMGTNWFMPALVNSRFGASGSKLEDGTRVCRFDLKKSRNDWRISRLVIIAKSFLRDYPLDQRKARASSERAPCCAIHGPPNLSPIFICRPARPAYIRPHSNAPRLSAPVKTVVNVRVNGVEQKHGVEPRTLLVHFL